MVWPDWTFFTRLSEDGAHDRALRPFSPFLSAPSKPALIAGASLLVVATTAVGTLLYKQRHRDLSPDGGHHDKESPRSLENTAPVSPSPKGDGGGLIGRIKKKSRFDYAEFEDSRSVEGMVEGGRDKSITAGADMGAFSPLTTDRAIMSATKGEDPAADAEAGQQPQPANILFSKYQVSRR